MPHLGVSLLVSARQPYSRSAPHREAKSRFLNPCALCRHRRCEHGRSSAVGARWLRNSPPNHRLFTVNNLSQTLARSSRIGQRVFSFKVLISLKQNYRLRIKVISSFHSTCHLVDIECYLFWNY